MSMEVLTNQPKADMRGYSRDVTLPVRILERIQYCTFQYSSYLKSINIAIVF